MNDTFRSLLLAIFLLGLAGTSIELLLLGHDEDLTQSIPLMLAGLAFASSAHVRLTRGTAAIRGFRAVMILFIVGGALGAALHFRANMEFQLEMDRAMDWLTLVKKSLRAKAPPALAPGAMVQLGLIGLVYTFGHPRLAGFHT